MPVNQYHAEYINVPITNRTETNLPSVCIFTASAKQFVKSSPGDQMTCLEKMIYDIIFQKSYIYMNDV